MNSEMKGSHAMRVLGKYIEAYRKRQQMTYEQLGALLGVSGSHLDNIVHGKNFGIDTFIKIVNLLEVPPDILLRDLLEVDNCLIIEQYNDLLNGLDDNDKSKAIKIIQAYSELANRVGDDNG